MSKQFLSRNCPACGASLNLAKKEVASKPAAEDTAYAELVPAWNGFFKDKVFFTYRRCEKCDLLYAPIFFTPKQLEKLYAQMPPNMDLVPIRALRKTQRGYFQAIKELSPLQGNYIEIGPDIGLFTENCVREGHFNKYWLFEPNRDVVQPLTETMQGEQHEIIQSMSGFSQVPDNTVGVIVMIHVLDHLLDPVTALKELRKKLMRGGLIVIVTHDESSLLRRIFGRRWPAFCLQHPEIYNPRSITNMLDAAGYEVVQLRRTINYFPIQFLFRHLLWALRIKIKSAPSFAGITVGLKLGNMITIAVPKAS